MVSLAEPVAAREAAPPRPAGRLAVLDGLRLLAALMVVAFHYTFRAPGAWGVPTVEVFPRVSQVTQYGRLGVELFFVISGFVICMSAWGRSLGGFFVSRATRLYPAYWLAVLATAMALNVLGHGAAAGQHVSFHDLLVNLTMLESYVGVTPVDGVYWTLALELHFYLLFAIVVWRGLTYRRVVLFCVLWIIAAVIVPAANQPVLNALIDPGNAPYFVAGVAMYLMYRFRPNILLWGIVGTCYALAIHQVIPTLDAIAALGGRHGHAAGFALITAIFAVMLATSLGWLSWVRGAWLTTAGVLTYPLYLLHQSMGWLVIDRLHTRVPKWPLVIGLVAAMLVAAWLVHRLVERPLAPRLKRALTGAIAETSADQQAVRRA